MKKKKDSPASALWFGLWRWSSKTHLKKVDYSPRRRIWKNACNNAKKAEVWALVLLKTLKSATTTEKWRAQTDTQMSRELWTVWCVCEIIWLHLQHWSKFPPYCAVAIGLSAVSVLWPQCFRNSVTWHRRRYFAEDLTAFLWYSSVQEEFRRCFGSNFNSAVWYVTDQVKKRNIYYVFSSLSASINGHETTLVTKLGTFSGHLVTKPGVSLVAAQQLL